MTYPNLDDTKASDRPANETTEQIVITPEMIEAGWNELASSDGDIFFPTPESRREILRRVFLAMLGAAPPEVASRYS